MTIKVLQLTSSIFGDSGVSSGLVKHAVSELQTQFDDIEVLHRDLSEQELPHFNAQTIEDIGKQEAALADELIAELQKADILVAGVPMYNFSVPSQFKAWMDHVARAGTTFKYTESGPVGLLESKKVFIVTSRGGVYFGQESDSHSRLLSTYFNFLGLTDLEWVYAEGVNLGDDSRQQSIAKAEQLLSTSIKTFSQHYQAEEAS